MKRKAISLIMLLVCSTLYGMAPNKFKVIQDNGGAILSEFYYTLPSDIAKIPEAELKTNIFHIINRYSQKALAEHQKMLSARVDAVVSVRVETKALDTLSSFKQEGQIKSTITIFNSTIQSESLIEDMTSTGKVYYLKQLAIFSVGRLPINPDSKAYSWDGSQNYLDRTPSVYTKKIKTYAEYQAESRKGTKLENHTTDAVDFIIENKDEHAVFFREMIYNDARLIKENIEVTTRATFNKNGFFPVSVIQIMTLKLPKELQKSLLHNYTLFIKSGVNVQSMHFPHIYKYDSKLNSNVYKNLNTHLEESIDFSTEKMSYATVSRKPFVNLPNVYLSVFVGEIHSGYLLLSSGDKVIDEIELKVQYGTTDTAKANYKIRYEIVY